MRNTKRIDELEKQVAELSAALKKLAAKIEPKTSSNAEPAKRRRRRGKAPLPKLYERHVATLAPFTSHDALTARKACELSLLPGWTIQSAQPLVSDLRRHGFLLPTGDAEENNAHRGRKAQYLAITNEGRKWYSDQIRKGVSA